METLRWFKLGVTDVTLDPPAETMGAVLRLQRFGHAISCSTTEDSTGRLVKVEVWHCRTCKACAEMKEESNAEVGSVKEKS
jgi:hypothetical protein